MPERTKPCSAPKLCVFTPSPIRKQRTSEVDPGLSDEENDMIMSPMNLSQQMPDQDEESLSAPEDYNSQLHNLNSLPEVEKDLSADCLEGDVGIRQEPTLSIITNKGARNETNCMLINDSDASFNADDYSDVLQSTQETNSSLLTCDLNITDAEITELMQSKEEFHAQYSFNRIPDALEAQHTATEDFW
ncbi:hypothetical protein FGB62_171g017 [Gracilaria domingensis]|nr:hypothetical protein FGB62_171g017 [Gracilaria domingensis]